MADAVSPVGDVVAGLGESPVWHPDSQTLTWVDIPAGVLYRTDPRDGRTQKRAVGAPLSLALPAADGALVLARGDDLLVLDAHSGQPRPWVTFPHRPNMRLNDGAWDRQGRLLIGTMVLPQHDGGPAALWRVDLDGTRRELVGGLRLANGIAWAPEADRLYLVDTRPRRIWVLDVDADGGVAAARMLIELGDGVGNPDGITVDSDGHIWVCLFGGWALRRYAPDGRLAGELRLPVQHPASCTFGGPDLATLFVTTASNRLDEDGRRAQPLAGRVLALHPGPTGHPHVLGIPPRLTQSPPMRALPISPADQES